MRFRPATFIGFAFARYFFKFYENSDIRKLKVWPFQRREKFLYISYWASKMSSWIILNAKVTKVNIPLKSIDNIYYRTSGFWTYICMWLSTKFLKNSSSVTCMYKSAELYKFEHGNSELLESESWLNQFMHGGKVPFPSFIRVRHRASLYLILWRAREICKMELVRIFSETKNALNFLESRSVSILMNATVCNRGTKRPIEI